MKVLFDYDNTLGATELIGHNESFNIISEALSLRGLTLEFDRGEFVRTFTGRAFPEMLKEVGTSLGISFSDDEINALNQEEFRRSLEALSRGVNSTQGAIEALEALTKSGDEFGIVSNSTLNRVRTCLKVTGQEKFFLDNTRIFSAYDSLPVARLKPAPDIYLHAFNAMGGPGRDFIAVEDSRSGVVAARAADARGVIGFIGTVDLQDRAARTKELFQAGAIVVLDDLSIVPFILSRFRAGDSEELKKLFGPDAWFPPTTSGV